MIVHLSQAHNVVVSHSHSCGPVVIFACTFDGASSSGHIPELVSKGRLGAYKVKSDSSESCWPWGVAGVFGKPSAVCIACEPRSAGGDRCGSCVRLVTHGMLASLCGACSCLFSAIRFRLPSWQKPCYLAPLEQSSAINTEVPKPHR